MKEKNEIETYSENNSTNSENFGFAVAIGFSIAALYIAFSPKLFVYSVVRSWIMWIVIIIAVAGTSIELGKSLKLYFNKEVDLSNLFLGIFMLVMFYFFRKFTFHNTILDLIYDFFMVFIFLLIGATSAIDGFLKIVQELKNKNIIQALGQSIGKTFTIIINIAGLLASIVAILQAFKVLN